MTSFRRLVIGIAEGAAVFSIFIFTAVGGIAGAASGAFRSSIYGLATNNVDVSVQGFGHVASVGAVIGFIIGAIGGFVVSSILAGTLFIFIQIERNTRSLLERDIDSEVAYSNSYRSPPKF
jgi:hypothetical protein